uniref:Efflux RND transporter periplasmic adaptor subunit n=1 Tax=Prevotella sp. GTC17260 TaxID=3236796 RepID=A0AB33JH36_9BACT
MDREITTQQKRRRLLMRLAKVGGAVGCLVVAVLIVRSRLTPHVAGQTLVLARVDRGDVAASVSASGKVVPMFEEIINSPISSRILKVYKRAGDQVEAGTPLMLLDLHAAETEYQRAQDDAQMRQARLSQLRVNQQTALSNQEMEIRVARMKMNRLEAELRAEQHLDSIGSSTRDNVERKRMEYHVARLQLQQQERQLANTHRIQRAEMRAQQLDVAMQHRSMVENRRTLEDARIRSPRRATLTYIQTQVGTQIGQGQQVAVIADMDHFKINAEIAADYADQLTIGGKANIRIGSSVCTGIISSIAPQAQNGIVQFTIELNTPPRKLRLRPGLVADVFVMTATRPATLRLPNGNYYHGAGEYILYVKEDEDRLVARQVRLGDGNFDFVEVKSGLQLGESVVTSDLSQYKNNVLKIKRQ